jgi:hypothetical protein
MDPNPYEAPATESRTPAGSRPWSVRREELAEWGLGFGTCTFLALQLITIVPPGRTIPLLIAACCLAQGFLSARWRLRLTAVFLLIFALALAYADYDMGRQLRVPDGAPGASPSGN